MSGASSRPALGANRQPISLEAYQSVKPLLQRFAAGRRIEFFIAQKLGDIWHARSTWESDQHELSEWSLESVEAVTAVAFCSCDAERNPRIEELTARYLATSPLKDGSANVIYKLMKNSGEEKVVAFVISDARTASTSAPLTQPMAGLNQVDSLFDAIIYVCLQYCSVSRRGDNFFGLAPDLLARAAGQLYLQTVVSAATGRANFSFYEVCCEIASAQYEGRSHSGYIILANPKSAALKPAVRFRRPIHISHATGARKLVEMATKDFALLFDGDYFFGFASLEQAPDCHHIRFAGRGTWSINRGQDMLGLISYGTPVETDRVLLKDDFLGHFARIFPTITADGLARIWEIATIASEQSVGTNILFTPAAANETARLSSQCIPIAPIALTPDVTRQLTAIDGTVIADITGKVHGVGAIMDGGSTENGTWQRGGRYNSAANYVMSAKHPAIIFIVSQDGYVDIVPPIDAQGTKWVMKRYLKLSSTAI